MPAGISIREIMRTDVISASEKTKAWEAVQLMYDNNVGSVVVIKGKKPVGIFTGRDLVFKALKNKMNMDEVTVGDVMTKDIVSVSPNDTVEDAQSIFESGEFRHLLVVNGNSLQGIISIKDLLKIRERVLQKKVDEKTEEILKVRDDLEKSLVTLNREMKYAGLFQKQLVAKKITRINGLKFSNVYEQTDQIGGDFFEVIKIDKEHVGIFVADVMGHGIVSAMIAIELKMNFDQQSRNSLNTAEVIEKMNRNLIHLMPESYFVAGFYGIVNTRTGNMNFTQFGLPKPTLLNCDTMRLIPIRPGNMPIGIREETKFVSGNVKIRAGYKLLLFTDGCTEQKNNAGKLLSEKRFIGWFKEMIMKGENNTAKKLYKKVTDYSEDQPINDDIAILLCEFQK